MLGRQHCKVSCCHKLIFFRHVAAVLAHEMHDDQESGQCEDDRGAACFTLSYTLGNCSSQLSRCGLAF